MEKQKLLDAIAPCSLLCHTCPGLRDGAVAQCARKLCAYFEGYYDFNDQNLPEEHKGWLPEFAGFRDRLEGYGKSECVGCRNKPVAGAGCIEGCVVPDCVKAHAVDFCAECPEFPCQKARDFFATVNNVIGRDWEQGSSRLREVGAARYFDEKKDLSHYISYRKKRTGDE